MGLIHAHLRACLYGDLDSTEALAEPASTTHEVGGTLTVFAPGAVALDAPALARLRSLAGCHDVPHAATRLEVGDPLCSVSAAGANAEQVLALLLHSQAAVLKILEISS